MSDKTDLTVDSDLIRALAALLDETHLTEIEYTVGERRIRVARTAAAAPTFAAPAQPAPTLVAPAGPPADAAGTIKSPMVGTAYLSPQPEAAPFVKVGDTVTQGQTLLIIEAMKVMNQIPSPRAGRVTAILLADGAPVEFGQALLVLE